MDGGSTLVGGGEQEGSGAVRVADAGGDERSIGGLDDGAVGVDLDTTDPNDELASGGSGRQRGPGHRHQGGDRHTGVDAERFGEGDRARHHGDGDELNHPKAETPVALGREEPGGTELGEGCPPLWGAPSGWIPRVLDDRPDVSHRAPVCEDLGGAIAQRNLIVRECEAHGQDLGIPRRRSATTLRWIWLVPA